LAALLLSGIDASKAFTNANPSTNMDCHPERSEGSTRLLATPLAAAMAGVSMAASLRSG